MADVESYFNNAQDKLTKFKSQIEEV